MVRKRPDVGERLNEPELRVDEDEATLVAENQLEKFIGEREVYKY